MTRQRVRIPTLGESVDGVVVVEWHVGVGDRIESEQVLVTVETDKVDTDVPSPAAGVVVEILAEAGAQLTVGDPICVLEA